MFRIFRFFPLFLPLILWGQPPERTIDHQIAPSSIFKTLYPGYGVCKVKLGELDDVSVSTASTGQCLVKQAVGWAPGQCGTGGAGTPGPAGAGVARGGTLGQLLAKAGATDYDTQWVDPFTLNASQTTAIDKASLITQIALSGHELSFASSDATTKSVTIPGLTLYDEGTQQGRIGNITQLNFKGAGVTAAVDGAIRANVTISGGGSSSGGDGRFIALNSQPTDLSSYASGQVLRINTPAPGKWMEVFGADNSERHSFQTDFTSDPTNPNPLQVGSQENYGYSSFGDIYGSLRTADGGQALPADRTPVMRFELQRTVVRLPNPSVNDPGSYTYDLVFLIRKTALTSAPASIYMRLYSGIPASNNEVDTIQLDKATDNPQHTYHTYLETSGTSLSTLWNERADVAYFNLFTVSPPTGDQVSNPLDLHQAKALTEIDPPGSGSLVVVAALPSSPDATKIYYLTTEDGNNVPGFYRREGVSWVRIRGNHLSESYLQISETQRILGFGAQTVIDKSSTWTFPSSITGNNSRISSSLRLNSGSFFNWVSSSEQSLNQSFGIIFYKYTLNAQKDEITRTEITLDSGVSLPSDAEFNALVYSPVLMGSGQILLYPRTVYGSSNTSSSYTQNNLYVLTLNNDETKITNIRKLNTRFTSITNNSTTSRSEFRIIKRGSSFLVIGVGNDYNNGAAGFRLQVRSLDIGNTNDALGSFVLNTTQSTSDFHPSGAQAGSYIANDFIYKNTYLYLPIMTYGRTRSRGTFSYQEGIIKIPKEGALSSSFYGKNITPNFTSGYPWVMNVRLADGTFISSYNANRYTVTINENEGLATASESELPIYSSEVLTSYAASYSNPSGTYFLWSGQQTADGDIIYFRTRSFIRSTKYATDGAIIISVNGDIQTVIDRRFQQDIVDGAIGNLLKTPRRVTELPAESGSKEEEQVYVEEDYTHANGVNITPQDFAGTELDTVENPAAQAGIGSRGWYAKADAGFQFGQIYPALPDNVVLISDARVYVKRGTLTNLAKIYIGETSYALTRVAQAAGTHIVNAPGLTEPDVDYYTIATALPDGDWDNIRFETTTAGTFIPASSTVKAGLYQFLNSDWMPAGFDAPAAQPDKDWKVAVEEDRPGKRQDKNIALAASGSTFTAASPFPGILRLTYNNDSTETQEYQRWTVNVPLAGFDDNKAPAVFKHGSVNYSLSYFETDAGIAIYRTPVVKASERVSAAGTVNGLNIQLHDGSWAGQTGETKALRTVDKAALQAAANSAQPVHVVPSAPRDGQRIEPLADITIHGGTVITAAESSGNDSRGNALNGLFVGYEDDSVYDSTISGDLGSADPEDTAKFLGIVSFSNARSAGNEANKTMVVFPTGFVPAKAYVNGVEYALGATVNLGFKPLTGLDGSFLRAGKKYYVNVEKSDGTRAFPDVVLSQGKIYVFDGLKWVEEKAGLNQDEVDGRIQPWARLPKPSGDQYIPADQICQEMTLAAHTALAQKQANRLYCITP